QLRVAGNGVDIDAGEARCAQHRVADGLNDHVAADLLELDVSGHGIKSHLAVNALDDHQAGVGVHLKFALLGDGNLIVGLQVGRLDVCSEDVRGHFDAEIGRAHV